MTDSGRTEAEARFIDEYGCGRKDAALAARAMFPLEDGVESSPRFVKESTRVAHDFGKEMAGLRGSEIGVAAERAIETLLELARDHREMEYVKLFEDALEHAGGPAAAPESGE